MGAATPFIPALIGAATTVYSAKQAGKIPKLPDKKEAPVIDEESKLAAAQREAQRRFAGQGRAGTVLSERSTLG